MARSKAFIFFLTTASFFIACDDNDNSTDKDTSTQTTYILCSSSDDQGTVFTYDFTKQTLNPGNFLTKSQNGGYGKFRDVAYDGKYIYSINIHGTTLSKINIEAFTLEKSINTRVDLRNTQNDVLRFYQNKIILSGDGYNWKQNTSNWFINIYDTELNLLDSIGIPGISQARDMIVQDGMIFLSVFDQNKNSILAFDLETKQLKREFDLSACELIAGKSHELIAASQETVNILNTIDLALVKTISKTVYLSCNYSSTPKTAHDTEGTLFYFNVTAQPAPFPYTLQSYNFETNKITDITDLNDFPVYEPIVYDIKNDLILVAAHNKLLILTREGEKVSECELPDETISHIFIQYE